TAYRSPGGAGVRLDGATSVGAEISPNFDSLLVKMTCRGKDFQQAVQRTRRALKEFNIAGVATNIGFLRALLREPDFVDRKSTRLNSSHVSISYAVFCLKKK